VGDPDAVVDVRATATDAVVDVRATATDASGEGRPAP
jgi:hypothetical protein